MEDFLVLHFTEIEAPKKAALVETLSAKLGEYLTLLIKSQII